MTASKAYDKFVATYPAGLATLERQQRRALTLTALQHDVPIGDPLRQSVGVYTIWEGPMFLYVGMVGTAPGGSPVVLIEPKALGKARTAQGLFGRLHDHAYGAKHDRLWLLYAEREIIPNLTEQERTQFGSGTLNLTSLIASRVNEPRFTYSAVPTKTLSDARAIETGVRRYGLSGIRPMLNPLGADLSGNLAR
jgi:hypothetical protein